MSKYSLRSTEIEKKQNGTFEAEENSSSCFWGHCTQHFGTDDALFDHVTAVHIEPLKKWVLSEQRKLEELKENNGTDGSKPREHFRCHWQGCGQFSKRGDAQKKMEWLQKHVFAVHAPKAKTNRCIFSGCPKRYSTPQALADHVRSAAHRERIQRNKKDKEEKTTCFEYHPRVHLPFVHDAFDARTAEWVRRRMNGEEVPFKDLQPPVPQMPKAATNKKVYRKSGYYLRK